MEVVAWLVYVLMNSWKTYSSSSSGGGFGCEFEGRWVGGRQAR